MAISTSAAPPLRRTTKVSGSAKGTNTRGTTKPEAQHRTKPAPITVLHRGSTSETSARLVHCAIRSCIMRATDRNPVGSQRAAILAWPSGRCFGPNRTDWGRYSPGVRTMCRMGVAPLKACGECCGDGHPSLTRARNTYAFQARAQGRAFSPGYPAPTAPSATAVYLRTCRHVLRLFSIVRRP